MKIWFIGKDATAGKDWRQKERGQQGMRWLESITDSVGMNWSKHWQMVEDRGAWHAAVHGVTKSNTTKQLKSNRSYIYDFSPLPYIILCLWHLCSQLAGIFSKQVTSNFHLYFLLCHRGLLNSMEFWAFYLKILIVYKNCSFETFILFLKFFHKQSRILKYFAVHYSRNDFNIICQLLIHNTKD